ncbi:2OG-Fe(II) oxygenase family oxidoreductase [Colletotrichum tofieldiae]|nr:2OG-Fe(II) oxygenase family oxidoreductase [Colletotrichum tofieldiae]
MTGLLTKLLGISAYTGLVAVTLPYIQQHDDTPPEPFVCHAQNYTTQIVSLDPLVIYIRDFLNDADIAGLLEAGEPEFRPSYVVKNGVAQGTPDRTSWSAGLPIENAAVQCVLKRAEGFMGTTLAPGGMRSARRSWCGTPRGSGSTCTTTAGREDGRDRRWNRIASFFAILQDECTGGDTWFPKVRAVTPQHLTEEAHWRRHEDGGLAFKPVRGNAVFWVNLHENGTGDERVVHAGLPVGAG